MLPATPYWFFMESIACKLLPVDFALPAPTLWELACVSAVRYTPLWFVWASGARALLSAFPARRVLTMEATPQCGLQLAANKPLWV